MRGPDESAFTALEPRQLLPTDGPAAVSALSCPHSHFTDSWSGSNPAWGLYLSNTSTGDGLRAYSKATLWNYAAVYGANTATTGSGTGVYRVQREGSRHGARKGGADGLEAITSVRTRAPSTRTRRRATASLGRSGTPSACTAGGRWRCQRRRSSWGIVSGSANYAARCLQGQRPIIQQLAMSRYSGHQQHGSMRWRSATVALSSISVDEQQ